MTDKAQAQSAGAERPRITHRTPSGAARSFYDHALEALQGAYDACFNHPGRDVLGMSNGPFSGVNKALGLIASIENELIATRARVEELEAALREARDCLASFCEGATLGTIEHIDAALTGGRP